jgi:hypothetical protein
MPEPKGQLGTVLGHLWGLLKSKSTVVWTCQTFISVPVMQLMLTKARAGPLQDADFPAGVLLSTVVDSPVARCLPLTCRCYMHECEQSVQHVEQCCRSAHVSMPTAMHPSMTL